MVYLNGTILFVVGLALIRAHNRWHWQWPILVTLTGWVLFLGGAYRMLMPEASQSPATTASHAMFAAMIVIGLFLSFKGYGPENSEKGDGR